MKADIVPLSFTPELVDPTALRPHPRNYRSHPDDQIEHIVKLIQDNGVYRNVVVANDGTILAGHGVTEAAIQAGLKQIPVIRIDIDPDSPRALKILAGDNYVSHLAEDDDRQLTELLRDIKGFDFDGLLGTGFDDMMLANLVFVTRPQGEIANFDEAAAWVGMPNYDNEVGPRIQIIVSFQNDEAREEFVELTGLRIDKKQKEAWTTRWPFTERMDTASVRFTG